MNARDIMTSSHLWVSAETSSIRQVAQMMEEHDIGIVPILDGEGKMEGIVTDRDICCRAVGKGISLDSPVIEIASSPVHTIHPDAAVQEVEEAMKEYRVRRLAVVDEDQRLIGVVSVSDLLRHCRGLLKERHVCNVLESVSTPAYATTR
jgi:CBS domain-containing protein